MRDAEVVNSVMNKTGWAYYDMKWLSESEALRENRWRRKKIEWLSSRIHNSFHNNKLHVGPLSPGCVACGEGRWVCAFLTFVCPCKCYFCPNVAPNLIIKPHADNVFFNSLDDFVEHTALCGVNGVSVSGGDSFSDLDGLIKYIHGVKKRSGKNVYAWAYTSGRELSESKLKRVKKAGLDEIRIDIAAIGYDIAPLKLATKWINTVTVEIPAIPEDFDRLTALLPKLKNIGVKHLNIHELMTSQNNFRAFVRRGYTFLHSPSIDVF